MNSEYNLQITVTKDKLEALKKCYESVNGEAEGDEFVRAITLRSLKKTINQFTEELIRLEAHSHAALK